jgi:hypothetical protein
MLLKYLAYPRAHTTGAEVEVVTEQHGFNRCLFGRVYEKRTRIIRATPESSQY